MIERGDLDGMLDAAVEPVDQQADADHLAVAEGMREAEKRGRRHAPGDEIVAGGNIDADRPPGRKDHHQDEDGDEKSAGRETGEQIQAVEKRSKHSSSQSARACIPLMQCKHRAVAPMMPMRVAPA